MAAPERSLKVRFLLHRGRRPYMARVGRVNLPPGGRLLGDKPTVATHCNRFETDLTGEGVALLTVGAKPIDPSAR